MTVVNTNVKALFAQNSLQVNNRTLTNAMQQLSTGSRINSAKDDAAGLAIAERMNTQVRGMNVAMRNANDAISLSQVGEGALGKVSDIFQRMRELAVQAANGTNNAEDRLSLDREYLQMAQEATRTLGGTQFNGVSILASTGTNTFQIGANSSSLIDRLTIDNFNWSGSTTIAAVVGTAVITGTSTAPTAITDAAGAQTAITAIDSAINAVNSQRATFGAVQNRFENVISNLMVASENQSAARSRIMDADYAAETANLSRAQILQQAGNAMVAQANQLPQQVMSLLQR
jgi:flagellin